MDMHIHLLGGKRVAAEGVRRFNEAVYRDVGIDNLIALIAEPTLESADAIFSHRDIAIICVTGGPGVARAALNSGKRAVVAGPGNPPVVVDETANLDRAARSIIRGGAYAYSPYQGRTSYTGFESEDLTCNDLGFRCAKDAQPR